MQEMDQHQTESGQEAATIHSFPNQSQETVEKKARVDAIWEQMNKGVSATLLKSISNEHNPNMKREPERNDSSHGWIRFLGMAPKNKESNGEFESDQRPTLQNGSRDHVKEPVAAPVPERDQHQADSMSAPPLQASLDTERRVRIDAAWELMNKGVPAKIVKSLSNEPSSAVTAPRYRSSDSWISHVGVAQKKTESEGESAHYPMPPSVQNGSSDDIKKLAATALAAVKEYTASGVSGTGKVEITEVQDFAGEDIQVKKLVDPHSSEGKASAGPSSVVDDVLEKIRKKPKLSVLDKTKKDWGEFKEENKGLEEELDVYRKSSNQYLDKVSFLQRTDYRAFERERDARLALQAKRKPDMREDS